jgi:chromosome segregation ATPase
MSEYNLNNDLITSIRAHSGISNLPVEAIEIVWKDAEKAARDRGTAIEFIAAELCKSLFAQAFSEARRNGKQTVDFQAYCREQLTSKDSLWKKLIGRKQSVAQAQAEVAQYESEITASRAALAAAQQMVVELRNDIEATEAELSNHTEEAVNKSIEEAAKLWHLKHRSNHNASFVENSISHAVQAEIVNRVLNVRLIQLRESLASEESKLEAFKRQLKDLEKQ